MSFFSNLFKAKDDKPKTYTFGSSALSQGSYIVNTPYQDKMQELQVFWDLYQSHHWVKRCVDAIAGAGSKMYELVPNDAADTQAGQDQDEQDAEIIHAFLNSPNPQDTAHDLLFKIHRDLMVFGVCFIERQYSTVDADVLRPIITKALAPMADFISDVQQEAEDIIGAVAPNGIPGFMRVLPAQQMEVVTDDDGNIVRFVQWKSNGKKAIFQPEEIIHILHPHAQDPRYGESPLKSLATVVTTDLLVDKRQKRILQNDIALEWFINLPNVAEEEAKRIYEQFVTEYRNADAKFNGIVSTTPDFKIENLAKSKDGDFLALGNDHKETICMCLGVPMSVIGSSEGTSLNGAGSDNHLRYFIEHAVRPISNKVETHINRDCISAFQNQGLDYTLKIILEDADDAAARIEMQANAVKTGLKTINEVREEENKPPLEGGDVAFVLAGSVVVPLSQIGATPLPAPAPESEPKPEVQPTEDEAKVEEAKDALKKAIRTLRKAL